jgi:hypothetical protein
MNIDFGYDAAFSWYVVLLGISGVVMLAMAAVKADGQSDGARAISALAGLAFLGYGIYLAFIFEGGTYWMFFQAFFLPGLLIVNFVRGLTAKRSARQRV